MRFLRRAGLADAHIAILTDSAEPTPRPTTDRWPACYISFSHVDSAFARWLCEALQERGVRCWLHHHEAHRDDDSLGMVDDAIQPWEKVLLCCSKTALTSWWIDAEVERALERERWLTRMQRRKEPALYGINLDGHLFDIKPAGQNLAAIKSRLVADFSGWEKKRANLDWPFDRLLEALAAGRGQERLTVWKV